jgi:hypothetical protein
MRANASLTLGRQAAEPDVTSPELETWAVFIRGKPLLIVLRPATVCERFAAAYDKEMRKKGG